MKRRGRRPLFLYQTPLVARPLFQSSSLTESLEQASSIPELPAETCKEIKASEGGHAVSGKYWFDSILVGEVVFAHCDMETEGKLII